MKTFLLTGIFTLALSVTYVADQSGNYNVLDHGAKGGGPTWRNMQVVRAAAKKGIYGEAPDQDQIQNLTLDHDSFNLNPSAK